MSREDVNEQSVHTELEESSRGRFEDTTLALDYKYWEKPQKLQSDSQ